MEEFLKELGIDRKYEQSESGSYVIDLKDSIDYGRIYSILDRSDLIDEDSESSQVTEDTSSVQYSNDEYTLTLLADFNEDQYKLTIREN